jgi:hypothetical protein
MIILEAYTYNKSTDNTVGSAMKVLKAVYEHLKPLQCPGNTGGSALIILVSVN